MPNAKQSVFINIHEAGAIMKLSPRHARRVLDERLPPMRQNRISNNAAGFRTSARWVRTQVEALAKQIAQERKVS